MTADDRFELQKKRQIDVICDEFEAKWSNIGPTDIELWLNRIDAERRKQLLEQLLAIDVELRRNAKLTVLPKDYSRLGEYAVEYAEELLNADSINRSMTTDDRTQDLVFSEARDETTSLRKVAFAAAEVPELIGRYKIEGVLGHGGFGQVFLGYDEQLQRHVAIKVPHPDLIKTADDAPDVFDRSANRGGARSPTYCSGIRRGSNKRIFMFRRGQVRRRC